MGLWKKLPAFTVAGHIQPQPVEWGLRGALVTREVLEARSKNESQWGHVGSILALMQTFEYRRTLNIMKCVSDSSLSLSF